MRQTILSVTKNRFILKRFISIRVLLVVLSKIHIKISILKDQMPIFLFNKLAQGTSKALQFLKVLLQITTVSLYLLLGSRQIEKK